MPNIVQTAALDAAALAKAIRDFAADHGFVVSNDTIDANGQFKLSKFGHDWYFRRQADNQTDYISGAGVQFVDTLIGVSCDGSFNEYHCRARMNDVTGPMPSVWLMTDDAGSYVHVIVQCSPDRYTALSFGRMDMRGLTTDKYAYYAAGNYYVFWKNWNNFTEPGSTNNYQNFPAGGGHAVGLLIFARFDNDNPYGFRASIDNGILDETLNFPAGELRNIKAERIWSVCNLWTQWSDATNFNTSQYLDFFAAVENQPITGGVPLTAIPFYAAGTDGNARTFVGELPDVRLVNMGAIAPAQVLTFGDDEWQCFPLKQKGDTDNCVGGPSPQQRTNSGEYGFAFKRNG